MNPKFVERPSMNVVGMGVNFFSILSPDKTRPNPIPDLWHRFMQRFADIPNKKSGPSYGLVECIQGARPYEMFYIAGVEVTDAGSNLPDMIQRVIPAGRYAQFTHKGKLDGLATTMNDIINGWLRESGMKLRDTAQIELYDRRFNPASDDSEFDILMPV